ncbi:MAG: hypothetical protein OEW17_11435 [Gemmatimonadota bacterium]|nr:hypothetical protein [Gemmatimonadota bacterium]
MVLQHVVVVEQPVTGGADVVPEGAGDAETLVGCFEDLAGPGDAGEEWCAAPRAPAGDEMLPGRNRLGSFPEVLGAKQLSPDRSRQQFLAGVRARAPEQGKEAAGIE